MAWTEDTFEHLFRYVTAEPKRRAGDLEQKYGSSFEPMALYAPFLEAVDSQEAAAPGNAATTDAAGPGAEPGISGVAAAVTESGKEEKGLPPVRLSMLIEYLEEEVADKELRKRKEAWFQDPQAEELLCGDNGLVGQEALDAYVSELVAKLRDFPFFRLEGGREAGAWIRDEVLAPSFKGRWDFYSNRKRGMGFDLPTLEQTLCGENQILDKLRYAKASIGI